MILIGVELGQRRGPSAVCVATNRIRAVDGRKKRHSLVRSLERLGVGTTFPLLNASLKWNPAPANKLLARGPRCT